MRSRRHDSSSARELRPRPDVRTLAVDIGGTGLKATVLDARGNMLVERVRVATPDPAPPGAIVDAVAELVRPLPPFDRVSVGFPGVVRDGRVVTAPHFGNGPWREYPLASALSERFGKAVRLLNDAEVQGYGVIRGRGLEFVVTLGTGVGTALFRDGELMPHFEFAQYPIRGRKTFNGYIGDTERRRIGRKRWQRRVMKTVETFRTLINFDVMFLGGGNAARLTIDLPDDVEIVSNDAGLTGGIRLWEGTPAPPPARSRR
jgi:polyphosphate glucokinase